MGGPAQLFECLEPLHHLQPQEQRVLLPQPVCFHPARIWASRPCGLIAAGKLVKRLEADGRAWGGGEAGSTNKEPSVVS